MWPNQQFSADLVAFTEGTLNGKLHFLCIVSSVLSILKVLSMRVFDLGLKRVDVVICGTMEDEYTVSRKSAMLESFSYFSKSTLRITFLLFSPKNFSQR